MLTFKHGFLLTVAMVLLLWGLVACQSSEPDRDSLSNQKRVSQKADNEHMVSNQASLVSQASSLAVRLEPGKDTAYYLREFSKSGYIVVRAHEWQDGIEFEVQHLSGSPKALVFLLKPGQLNRVSRIEVIPVHHFPHEFPEPQGRKVTEFKLQETIEQLPLNQALRYYLPVFHKLGRIEEYRMEASEAIYRLEVNDQYYRVRLTLDPETNLVNRILMDQRVIRFSS